MGYAQSLTLTLPPLAVHRAQARPVASSTRPDPIRELRRNLRTARSANASFRCDSPGVFIRCAPSRPRKSCIGTIASVRARTEYARRSAPTASCFGGTVSRSTSFRDRLVEAPIPADGRIVVVRAGVGDRVRDVVPRQVRIVWIAAERELQHAHARQAERIAQARPLPA